MTSQALPNVLPKAMIFGAGNAGQSALRHLQSDYELVAFIDNAVEKHGQQCCDLPIIHPKDIGRFAPQKVLIASEYGEHIYQQLQQMYPALLAEVLPARMIKPQLFEENQYMKQNALIVLKVVTEFLQSNDVRHYVDAGTLLGIYRDNALIEWDDDLDIALHANDVDKLIEHKNSLLDNLLMQTQCEWQLDCHFTTQAFGAVPKGALRALKLRPVNDNVDFPLMDFFIKYVDGARMDYCLASRGIEMPSMHFDELQQHSFSGFTVILPGQVELYLQRHYGNWRVPQRDWSLSELTNATLLK